MGQYYKAIFLSNNCEIIGWSESQGGLKMTEHCYTDDPFVIFIQKELYNTPRRVVWAGDYAEPEDEKNDLESAIKALRNLVNNHDNIKESDKHHVEHALKMLNRKYTESFDTDDYSCIAFALNFAKINLYSMCYNEEEKYMNYNFQKGNKLHKYIINHTLKEYVNVLEDYDNNTYSNEYDIKIHPLPLLTAEVGTGGGGDYSGTGEEHVGIWARHIISTSDEIPEGYAERLVKF